MQVVFVSSYTPESLKTAVCIILITPGEKSSQESYQASELCLAAFLVWAEDTEPWAWGPPYSQASRYFWVSSRAWPAWRAPDDGWEYVKAWVGKGEVGWGGISASVCVYLVSSHDDFLE